MFPLDFLYMYPLWPMNFIWFILFTSSIFWYWDFYLQTSNLKSIIPSYCSQCLLLHWNYNKTEHTLLILCSLVRHVRVNHSTLYFEDRELPFLRHWSMKVNHKQWKWVTPSMLGKLPKFRPPMKVRFPLMASPPMHIVPKIWNSSSCFISKWHVSLHL